MQSQLDNMAQLAVGMTNFDHTIDADLEGRLREQPNAVYAQYSGWNFCGFVWFDDRADLFQCEVWQYRQLSGLICGQTLEEIMDSVSEKYGSL